MESGDKARVRVDQRKWYQQQGWVCRTLRFPEGSLLYSVGRSATEHCRAVVYCV